MKKIKVALIGNPNAGKSTIFNDLTGLRQKTANFPGVTVDKKTGTFTIDSTHIDLLDLPGTYSLFPNSKDEKLVGNILCNPMHPNFPDVIIYVADVNQLERHLLLATQIIDLNIPVILALNMIDLFNKNGNTIDTELLQKKLGIPVIVTDARHNIGIDQLKKTLLATVDNIKESSNTQLSTLYPFNSIEKASSDLVNNHFHLNNSYRAKLWAHHHNWLDFLTIADVIQIKSFVGESKFEDIRFQIDETMARFAYIQRIMQGVVRSPLTKQLDFTLKLDRILTHKYIGPLIFFGLMFILFQSIFSWAETPMTWIEDAFSLMGEFAKNHLPSAWYTDLLIDGLLAGLSGVMVFIPQITILFLFLGLLEESGYMSRVVYMFDHIMQKVGLNGRSMVALISSGACAIPAIMSTRTIGNWKERLITIMVAPIIPCSARIPVYTVLIALMVPHDQHFGPFNAQGIAFMLLYLLGIAMSLIVAFILKQLIKSDERSYLMIELPHYKRPLWSNVFLELKEKIFSFVFGAGKIIIVISIVLWFLASFGPYDNIEVASKKATQELSSMVMDSTQQKAYIQSKKLEASYAGLIGKIIEPAIQPLGFDWKIGIALITSFAAREVFVGTMATIYSIGGDAEESSVRERMAKEQRSGTIKPMYDFATSLSLIIFYAFAMQCMSTLAITKKETNGWKWPVIQFLSLTALAYLGSWVVYHLFS
jgi:ferrous iron transport protein B